MVCRQSIRRAGGLGTGSVTLSFLPLLSAHKEREVRLLLTLLFFSFFIFNKGLFFSTHYR